MKENIDIAKKWEYENGFYLTVGADRLSKFVAHLELYRMAEGTPGDIAEFGVYKGASLSRWAIFRSMFSNEFAKKIFGFDVFGAFPHTNYEDDVKRRAEFVDAGGENSISKSDFEYLLKERNLDHNVELIEGNILETLPDFLANNPHTRFSLINLDTDVYEPAKCILEHCWDRLTPGGVLILDDYATFAGETVAVEEFIVERNISSKVQSFPFAQTPCYIVKEAY